MSSPALDQELISIKQACKLIPTRPAICTVWRWIEKGCRGHRLQSWLVGGMRFTSKEAIETFIENINQGSGAIRTESPSRSKKAEAAEKELRDLGV